MASIGPVSMSTGSQPTRQVSTTRARGVQAERLGPRPLHEQHGARTPSEICDDEPAVWTPSGRATGFSWARPSAFVSRMPSSRADRAGLAGGLARRRRGPAPSTGMTWVAKRSSAQARAARCWDCRPKASQSARDDAPLVGDALGAFELGRELVVGEVAAGARPGPGSGSCRSSSRSGCGTSTRPRSRPRRRRRRPPPARWPGSWPAGTSRTASRRWWPRSRAAGPP